VGGLTKKYITKLGCEKHFCTVTYWPQPQFGPLQMLTKSNIWCQLFPHFPINMKNLDNIKRGTLSMSSLTPIIKTNQSKAVTFFYRRFWGLLYHVHFCMSKFNFTTFKHCTSSKVLCAGYSTTPSTCA
jgi:hypothetical protein